MRRAALALILCGAALAAGCGEEESEPLGADQAFPVDLTLTLDPDGKGGEPAREQSVACDDPEQCFDIEVSDFDPVPPGTACTEIYGGPDVLQVEGHIGDQDVKGTFTRENGCEIDRFDRFTPALEEVFPDYEPGTAGP